MHTYAQAGSHYVVIAVATPAARWCREILQTVDWAIPLEAPTAFVAAQLVVNTNAGLILLSDVESGFRLEMGVDLIRRVAPAIAIVGLSPHSSPAYVERFFRAGGDLLLTDDAWSMDR